MNVSKKNRQAICRAIREPIAKIREESYTGISIEKMEGRLIDLQEEILSRIIQELNSISQPDL